MTTHPHQANTYEKKIVVKNKLGLHARPASVFVRIANQYSCEIIVQKGKQKVNGKSIMGILMLAAGPGSKIIIRAIGPDALKALNELEKILEDHCGEKDAK